MNKEKTIEVKLLLETIHLLKIIAHRLGVLPIDEMAELEEKIYQINKIKLKP